MLPHSNNLQNTIWSSLQTRLLRVVCFALGTHTALQKKSFPGWHDTTFNFAFSLYIPLHSHPVHPSKGIYQQRISESIPSTDSICPQNTLLRERHSCESYKESESKIPHEYYAGIRRKRCKWFPRAPPVLMTISYILGKSQQI